MDEMGYLDGDSEADRDGQSLVQILSGLGLAGLSNSLLQVQQHHDDSASLDSTFTTARRLEIWNEKIHCRKISKNILPRGKPGCLT